MKIAVSGSHGTGKTTLVAELLDLLPGFSAIDEPYHLLEADGHVFSAMPTIDEFELQLEHSIGSIRSSGGDVIFDRCPLDMLAYLSVHGDSAVFDIDRRVQEIVKSVRLLDLVVFVPIEVPDRIVLDNLEDKSFRIRVDEELEEIILGDRYGIGVPAVEVSGSPGERALITLSSLKSIVNE